MLKVTVGGMNEKYPVGLFFQEDQPKLPQNLGTLMKMKNQWCAKERDLNVRAAGIL